MCREHTCKPEQACVRRARRPGAAQRRPPGSGPGPACRRVGKAASGEPFGGEDRPRAILPMTRTEPSEGGRTVMRAHRKHSAWIEAASRGRAAPAQGRRATMRADGVEAGAVWW